MTSSLVAVATESGVRRTTVAEAAVFDPAKNYRRPKVAKRPWRTTAEPFDESKVTRNPGR